MLETQGEVTGWKPVVTQTLVKMKNLRRIAGITLFGNARIQMI